MAEVTKMKGTVKWFDPRKGYGFITDENGEDHFCHFSGVEKGRHYVGFEDGDQVEFTVSDDPKRGKTQATGVVLLNEKRPPKKKPEAETGGDNEATNTVEQSEPAE